MQTLSIFSTPQHHSLLHPKRLPGILAAAVLLFFAACKKDNPVTPAPENNQLEIAAKNQQLGDAGQEIKVGVTASGKWTVSLPAGTDWLTLSKSSGETSDSIAVKALKTNNTGVARSVTLSASLDNGKITGKTLVITQPAGGSAIQVNLVWARILGGNGNDYGYTILKTADGGSLLGGRTSSNANGDVPANHGGLDALVIKLDAAGNLQWEKNYGGSSDEVAAALAATDDGGYVITGYTISNNTGDVDANKGGVDFWVIKVNSAGNLQWKKTMGGSNDDWPNAVAVTTEGKIVVAGYSKSNNVDVGSNKGNEDVWIVTLESNTGNLLWKKVIGGNGSDIAKAVVAMPDGGIVVGATSGSNNNGDVPLTRGSSDFWLVRLDKNGTTVWSKTAGGPNIEELYSLALGAGNTIVAAGSTRGNGGDVNGTHGGDDMWVIQVNADNGNLNWQKALGGTVGDIARAVAVTGEGNIVVAGHSYSSNNGDVGADKGAGDFWVVGLSQSGEKQWSKLLGGNGEDIATGIIAVSNNAFVVVGYSQSSASGDVGLNHGNSDIWVTRISTQ